MEMLDSTACWREYSTKNIDTCGGRVECSTSGQNTSSAGTCSSESFDLEGANISNNNEEVAFRSSISVLLVRGSRSLTVF